MPGRFSFPVALPYLLLALAGLALGPRAGRAQDSLRYDNWRLVQAEEFNQPGDSSQLAGRWAFAYPWGRNLGGYEVQYHVGSEVNIHDGKLWLTAHRLAQPRTYQVGSDTRQVRYTSGMLFSKHPGPDSLRPAPFVEGSGYGYGLFEMRCRQPRDADSWPSFWLFGNPEEVDIFEGTAQGFSNNVHLHAHEYWRPGPVEQTSCQCLYYWPGARPFADGYHRYTLAWLPGEMIYYFDGVPIRRETRFRPLGNGLELITALGIVAWEKSAADTLAIDYIRVYRPRQPLGPFGTPRAQAVRNTLPHQDAPEQSNPRGPQTWQLVAAAPGELALALRDNLNPACDANLPLPQGPNWLAPWRVGRLASPLVVRLDSAQAPLRWTLLDALGQLRQQGQAGAGPWQPPTVGLAPGAYRLRLQNGQGVGYQAIYVLEQPAASRPTAEWLAVTPPELP